MKYNTMTHTALICTDGTRKVEGQKIILEEYPEFECYSYTEGCTFFVCEYESGRSFATALSLKIAKERAIKNIDNAGIKKVRAAIKDSIKQYGYANKRTQNKQT